MDIQTASEVLDYYINKDIPSFLWGGPGVGKSDTVRLAAKKRKWGMIDFRAALRDPVDIRGLPTVNLKEGTTIWLVPSELPNVKRHGKNGILFMDELNTAPVSVMNACLGLVLDRRVGDYVLPDGWAIAAAGNRQSDRAAVNRVPTPLSARFAHIDVEPDLEVSITWMVQNKIHELITGFLRFRPQLLYTMEGTDLRAFPNPRNWARVSKVCEAPNNLRMNLVKGIVGEGPAGEFEAFVSVYMDLPSLDQIVKGPKTTNVPDNPAGKYAVAGMLSRRSNRNNFGPVVTYAERLGREFEIVTVLDAAARDKGLCDTKAFTDFSMRNKDVVIRNSKKK